MAAQLRKYNPASEDYQFFKRNLKWLREGKIKYSENGQEGVHFANVWKYGGGM